MPDAVNVSDGKRDFSAKFFLIILKLQHTFY